MTPLKRGFGTRAMIERNWTRGPNTPNKGEEVEEDFTEEEVSGDFIRTSIFLPFFFLSFFLSH